MSKAGTGRPNSSGAPDEGERREAEIDAALRSVLTRSAISESRWGAVRERGADTQTIRVQLNSLIGEHGVTDSRAGICHIKSGDNPRFWFGSYVTDREPDLEGAALVARIRKVLEIPPDRVGRLEDRGWVFTENSRGYWQASNKELKLKTAAGYHSGKLEAADAAEYLERNNAPAPMAAGGPLTRGPAGGENGRRAIQPPLPAGQLALFDYDQLDPTTAVFVRERTREIKDLQKRAVGDIIEIGKKLTEVKSHLRHGEWGPWLESEFNWSHDTANRFINVAMRFAENTHIANYAPSALYQLAASSTPEGAREEAEARAGAGEEITTVTAKEIVKTHRVAERTSVRTPAGDMPKGVTRGGGPESLFPAESIDAKDDGPGPGITVAGPVPEVSTEGWKAAGVVRPVPSAETDAWDGAVIQWTTTLFKHDGDPLGRRVQVAVTANGRMLVNRFYREHEIFDGRAAIGWQPAVVLPKLIAVSLTDAKGMLPARLAAAEKQAAPVKPAPKPAAKNVPGKKSGGAIKAAAAKKSAPKKSAGGAADPSSARQGGK